MCVRVLKMPTGSESTHFLNTAYPFSITMLLCFIVIALASAFLFGLSKGKPDEKPPVEGKQTYLSVLNIIAALCVVLMHANGVIWSKPRPTGNLWWSSNFIETTCYFAVPVFFMITGATLMEYRNRYDTKTFLLKRFKKTFIPFIIWSIIACAFLVLTKRTEMDWNIFHIIENIFSAKYFGIFWFFPTLFMIYFSIPVLSAVQNKIPLFKYIIILGLSTTLVLPLLCFLVNISHYNPLNFPLATGSLLYPIMGYVLSRCTFDKKTRILIYTCGLLAWLFEYFGTTYVSYGLTHVVKDLKPFSNFIYSASVFLFVKQIVSNKTINKKIEKIIFSVAQLTFGIYLIHCFLLKIIPDVLNINTASLSWRIFGGIGVFLLSGLITFLLKKIPVLKHLTP